MFAELDCPWKRLLAEPGTGGHIVQLYQDNEFYAEAISHFAIEGFARGEPVILVPTKPHWELVSRRLTAKGANLAERFRDGQLTVLDADVTLAKFMQSGRPDGSMFKTLARDAIVRSRQGRQFPRVRWWGEMVNVLYNGGNPRGSIELEELFDEVAREEHTSVFCSFLVDKFDPRIYEDLFNDICRTHRHIIPARDYAQHRDTVDRAVSDVIGDIRGPLLQSLITWSETPAHMPSSQGLILWLKDHMPQRFAAVLARAREIERTAIAAQHV